jgi:hypothetical protein
MGLALRDSKKYLVILPFVALAIIHSLWWLLFRRWLCGAGSKRIGTEEREEVFWLLNPAQFLGVLLIMLVINCDLRRLVREDGRKKREKQKERTNHLIGHLVAMDCRALYFCYLALTAARQTQVLPYLRCLAREGVEITVITFEREGPTGAGICDNGIQSYSLRYHKHPTLPATVYDILAGAWLGIRLSRTRRYDILHARGHIAAAMAAIVKQIAGGKPLRYPRLHAEEYVDAGVWPEGGLS